MKHLKLLAAVIIIAAVAVSFLIWHKPAAAKTNLTKVTLAMDWTPNTDHTGVYVALSKGWYKAQGIDLQILPYSANVTSTNLVLSNKADVGISTTEDVVSYNAKDQPVVSIGAVIQHNTSGFIVRADSGISRPRDLDGKVYGGYGSLGESAVVSEVIQKDGGQGKFTDVTLNVEAMQALESKKIDFVWGFQGWEVIEAKHDNLPINFFPITKYGIPDSPNLEFVATPDRIKNQPQLLKRFMTATAQGYEYARQHPQASAQILINSVPKGTFPDTSLVYDSQAFLSAHYADPGRKWGVQDLQAWTGYPQFMLNSGVVDNASGKPVKTLDFSKLFTNRFLP